MSVALTALPEGARRLVILGGSFDPVHCGHLSVLAQARLALGADAAWLLPTGVQPLRPSARVSAEDRLAMARVAVGGYPGLAVCELEARRPGPSFTADTAATLAVLLPEVECWWLLGADAARGIAGWSRYRELLGREHFGLVNRTGVPPIDAAEAESLGFASPRTRLLELDSPAVSATEIRRRLAAGESTAGMLPTAVAEVIRERGLYGAGAGGGMDNERDDLR